MVAPSADGNSWVGRSLRRVEDPSLVTGQGRFTADLPAALWVRFVRGHLVTAAIGVGLGVVIALGIMHALKSLLYGVQERDPLTYTVVAVTILVVSALASIPSLFRLRRINPADCLRSL